MSLLNQIAQVLDTLFVAFILMISKDRSSLNELAHQAPEKLDPKGKRTVPSGNLVDILFSLLDLSSPKDCDPLAFFTPGSVYTDAELRVAGIGKKEKLTVRSVEPLCFSIKCLMSFVTDGDDTFNDQE